MAQSSAGSQSLRRHVRPSPVDHDGSAMTMSRLGDTDWEAKEALRQRELEEARARAAQMEKTMRWWSDCTANWREKWSKVRNERNKARDEVKILRTKLDTALKETSSYKREKVELENQNEELKKEMEKIHMLLIKHAGQWDQKIFEVLEMNDGSEREFPAQVENKPDLFSFESIKAVLDEKASTSSNVDQKSESDDFPKDPKSVSDHEARSSPEFSTGDRRSKRLSTMKEDLSPYDEDYLLQKLSMLQLRLEEATKTLQIEREEKVNLHRSIEKIQTELQEWKDKCEDLKLAKQETVRELLTLQDQHRDTIQQIQSDLQDETNTRESVDRRMADLRAEVGILTSELQSYILLERLQAENASEWGKRERLETEKLGLERDNKKLKAEVRDLQERLERRGNPGPTSDTELRNVLQELSDKTKELSELKHSHSKLKKVLQDKMTELAHAIRRAEQYETEVKRLRSRVEELKRELAVAEDEVDSATNNIRKLQRTNDELQEQVESLQVQLEHLHTRLRNSSTTSLRSHRKQSPILTEEVSDEDIHEY